MIDFKLKSLAAPKSASGSTLTTPDRFAMVARCARLKRELKANRKILGIWGQCMITDLIKFVLEYNDLLVVITIMNLISKNIKVKNKHKRYQHG